MKEELDDLLREHSEAQEMWANFGQEGLEDLTDELNELEINALAGELNMMNCEKHGNLISVAEESEEV